MIQINFFWYFICCVDIWNVDIENVQECVFCSKNDQTMTMSNMPK
jgi:hypothetical protein